MANPYTVLGVKKSDDEKAIKSAFRKLAKKYHPDQNKEDKNAQSKFAEINQAYEILGDKEKKAQFDRGEIDEKGNPKFAGFQPGGGEQHFHFRQGGARAGAGSPFGDGMGGGFGGGEDILNDLFGAAFAGTRGASRAQPGFEPFAGRQANAPSLDIELNAAVTIEDLLRGKTSIVMPNGKRMSVSVPAEAEDGQVIRLKGQGKSTPGRTPGDALVKIRLKAGGKLVREGTNLRVEAALPLKTAITGGKVAVETPDGKLSLTIPAGTNSGKIFRLKGKGLPKKAGGRGDLLVSTVIHLSGEEMAELAGFYAKTGQ